MILSLLLACVPPLITPTDTAEPTDSEPVDSAPIDTDTDTDSGQDTDTGPDDTGPVDEDWDDDGYIGAAFGGDDCDDQNAAIHPGAEDTWYDGVDSDCGGNSDFDQDGDGLDSADHGGSDCDDDREVVGEDCPPLGFYTPKADAGGVDTITSNLSGITWNGDSGSYFGVRDNGVVHEFDTAMTELRELDIVNPPNGKDTEDLVYLGSDEFAIVAEDGWIYIGTIDSTTDEVDLSVWQKVHFADFSDAGNGGSEGIAYDPASETFWACREKDDMEIHEFARPEGDDSYEDGLVVSLNFTAELALRDEISDISSCIYDPRSGHLLVLSHESDKLLQVDPADGAIHAEMDVDIEFDGYQKPEGVTLNDDQEMLIVGEPNTFRFYSFTGP